MIICAPAAETDSDAPGGEIQTAKVSKAVLYERHRLTKHLFLNDISV